jgi:hypothetical protein
VKRTAALARIGWEVGLVGLAMLAWPRSARAQATEPGLTTVDPRTDGVALPPGTPAVAPSSSGSSHVFDAFRVHAENSRSMRLAGGTSSLIVGATLIGMGLVAEQAWDQTYGTVLWVSGTVTALGGGLALVFPTDAERTAEEHGVYFTKAPSAEQEAALEQSWAVAAEKARGGRKLGAGIALAFSAIAIGSGIGVLASNMKEEPRHTWSTVLLVGGGVFGASGVATLMLETPTESSYAAFMAARGKSPKSPAGAVPAFRIAAAPLPNGGFVGVSAVF